MQDRQSQTVLLLLLAVVAAAILIPKWLRTNKVNEAKRWCEEYAALLDGNRVAYAADPAETFFGLREQVGWYPELFQVSNGFGGGIEDDGEIRVSFNVSFGSYDFSSRTGWTSGAPVTLTPVSP